MARQSKDLTVGRGILTDLSHLRRLSLWILVSCRSELSRGLVRLARINAGGVGASSCFFPHRLAVACFFSGDCAASSDHSTLRHGQRMAQAQTFSHFADRRHRIVCKSAATGELQQRRFLALFFVRAPRAYSAVFHISRL